MSLQPGILRRVQSQAGDLRERVEQVKGIEPAPALLHRPKS
jgi:hypothetical protein